MSETVRADAIVVAAGRSARMGGTDKLAAPIAGRPLLAWTLGAIAAAPEVDGIVLVTSPDRIAGLSGATWLPPSVAAVVPGGERRQESVRAGFEALPAATEDRVVLVHDGARPLVAPALVSAVARAAAAHGAAIPVLSLGETVKRVAAGLVVETIDRAELATAQTPQGATRSVLAAAWRRHPAEGERTFTDEAALLEACKIPVHAISGHASNLKVTVPDDLGRVATALGGSARVRVGIGHDGHSFGPGGPLVLGGLTFPGAPRLSGHSDGDAVLHAVADALLGAAVLGDLGRLFPSDERTPRGIASADLLRDVVERVSAAGYRPLSADVTVVGARPRLSGRLDEMAVLIGELLATPPATVNVKASTGNLDGMEGAGRGVSAHALVMLEESR